MHLAIHAIETIVQELTPFYGADCPAAVVFARQHAGERILRGTLADIAAQVSAARRSIAPRSFSSAARSRRRIFATARSTTPTIAAAFGEVPDERGGGRSCAPATSLREPRMTAWDALAARRTGIPVFAPGHVWLAGAGPGDPGPADARRARRPGAGRRDRARRAGRRPRAGARRRAGAARICRQARRQAVGHAGRHQPAPRRAGARRRARAAAQGRRSVRVRPRRRGSADACRRRHCRSASFPASPPVSRRWRRRGFRRRCAESTAP